VTCAGVLRDNLVHRMTESDWDTVVDTHLKGTFFCAQAAQAVMVPRATGSMVLLSSGSARGNRGQLNYSAAKAGIQAMASTLALELGRFGIRVNAVAPGFIETRMTRAIAERTGVDYEEVKANYAKNLALGRVGRPDEIASVISFFASDDASYVTGQTLHVRGSL
jgi:3-oxoacyl-[acyl-carrier protein] reductase